MSTAIAKRTRDGRRKGGKRRPRMSRDERRLMELESLRRAVVSPSLSNFPIIIEGFAARGIPVADINPRENVFTFNAWRALGRTVRKGEKGLAVATWAPVDRERTNPETGNRETVTARVCRKAYVFHVSQTEALAGGPAGAVPAAVEPIDSELMQTVAALPAPPVALLGYTPAE